MRLTTAKAFHALLVQGKACVVLLFLVMVS